MPGVLSRVYTNYTNTWREFGEDYTKSLANHRTQLYIEIHGGVKLWEVS